MSEHDGQERPVPSAPATGGAEDALTAFEHSGTAPALDRTLEALDRTELTEHAEVFARVHARLRRGLDESAESLPGGAGTGADRNADGAHGAGGPR